MKTKWILAGLLLGMGMTANAENKGNESNESGKGKPIVTVFGNFHSGFGETNDDRGFELERSYLGYQYTLPGNIELKAVMDIGQSKNVSDYQRIAYIKNAMISWKNGNLKLNGGLISTTQFNMQEKFWGYRYIMKSFQDEYKFGSSADLGLSASYRFADWIEADLIVVNGEGYKKVQTNDGLMYGVGATLTPLEGLSIRIYGSLNEAADKDAEDVYNVATFVGYKNKHFSLGAEYNYFQNSGNVKDQDKYGLSVYGTLKLGKNFEAFGRYDNLSSKDDWSEANDGSMGLVGVQFKLGKYVKVAPNFRLWEPKASGADTQYAGYVSCSFGL